MREVIEFAHQRGTLLSPEVVRWLLTVPRPLEELQRAWPSVPPMVLTLDALGGQRGAVAAMAPATTVRSPPSLAAAIQAAVVQAPMAPRLVVPLLPPAPLAPPVAPRPPPMPAPAPTFAPGLALSAQARAIAEVAHALPPDAPRLADQLASLAPPVEVTKDITGKSTCTGEMADFTRYFNDRLRVTRRILKQRRELAGSINIEDIPRVAQASVVKIIGMVQEVRTTKNGFRIIELEDQTGVVPILVRKDDHRAIELGEDPSRVMQDEVIGVHAKVVPGKDILYLEGLWHPDVELDHAPQRAKEPALACFISDVHFGAKTFLDPLWDRFVRWLQGLEGSPEQRAQAREVKFLVIAGDVVDGVGVYPGQDTELAIPDIGGQYEFCAQQLARIPERIRVIMLPGNHDAVRPAEPQPAMAEKHTRGYKSNVTFVGNPAQVNLMGVEVLAYHGVSLIDFITKLRGLDVHRPIAIMEEILKRRHLAPTYGGHTPLAPEARDYMVIDRVPDVFVTGHLHTCDVGEYRGVKLINAGTWQGQTSYQKTLGIQPEPARVPIMDLSTGKHSVLHFERELTAA